jgi:hypothetical protein
MPIIIPTPIILEDHSTLFGKAATNSHWMYKKLCKNLFAVVNGEEDRAYNPVKDLHPGLLLLAKKKTVESIT